MTPASLIVGMLFIIPGGLFLLIRLYYVWVKGDIWNNMPTVISWGLTVFFTGLAVSSVGILTSDCPDGCTRVDGTTGGATVVSGGIVAAIGVIMAFYDTCCCRKTKSEMEVSKIRNYWSGLDFVFLGIGLSVLVAQQSLGDCPRSCAQAVVIYAR